MSEAERLEPAAERERAVRRGDPAARPPEAVAVRNGFARSSRARPPSCPSSVG